MLCALRGHEVYSTLGEFFEPDHRWMLPLACPDDARIARLSEGSLNKRCCVYLLAELAVENVT